MSNWWVSHHSSHQWLYQSPVISQILWSSADMLKFRSKCQLPCLGSKFRGLWKTVGPTHLSANRKTLKWCQNNRRWRQSKLFLKGHDLQLMLVPYYAFIPYSWMWHVLLELCCRVISDAMVAMLRAVPGTTTQWMPQSWMWNKCVVWH